MAAAARVVSLVPSMTETLLSWDVVPVACSRFSDQPGIRTVGGTKDPDVPAIVDLAPDLVLVDAEENRREDHDALVAAGLVVHATDVRSLGDLDRQLPEVAARVGATWRPLGPVEVPVPTRSAVVPIWRRPWMALGRDTYGSSLLASIGVANAVAGDDDYPQLEPGALAALGADLVVLPDEPYPFAERHHAELAGAGTVVPVDGRDLFWWGARTAAARARLASVLTAVGRD